MKNMKFIAEIGMNHKTIHVSDENPVGLDINNTLNAIKTGKMEDPFDWMVTINSHYD